MAQFWNPAYSCFTFGKVDLVPTVEEYTALLRCPKQKGDGICILWVSLRDLIVAHPDIKKKVDVFALSIYGLVIFPKALRHIDEAIADLFDQFDKWVTSVLLLLAWFHSHFWKVDKVSYRVFFENYSPKRTLSGELLGWFLMKFFTDVGVLTGSLCWEFGELLGMLLCSC
ncbi:hypothetical protein CXB51_001201 [Gossypium anomalum]|uniref:DUF7745 domain-containing protein n=1 Tax=Gossypium anomalum TaxID=47600 RepID=A0A8J6DBU8_9ROSI|nr:hypothetical protein CXB51_001201 [Gossypium anomalum]